MLPFFLALAFLQTPAHKFDAPACPTEMVKQSWLEPIYPQNAVEQQRGGKVDVEALVSADGSVKDVAVVSGDKDLGESAAASLREWRFQSCEIEGKPADVTVPIEFEFHPQQWVVTSSGKEPPSLAPDGKVLDHPMRVRVNGGVTQKNIRYKVDPAYPPEAKKNGVQGSVVVHALIGRDGGLTVLNVQSGDPILKEATLEALKQWRYKPYFLKGSPVEIDTTITVNFQLH